MDTRDLLKAIQKGQKPDQETIVRLRDEGLIEVADVTHMQSRGREYIPTILTAKGLRLVEQGNQTATATAEVGTRPREAIAADTTKRWDVFISHASEDKEEQAHSLGAALRRRGVGRATDNFTRTH